MRTYGLKLIPRDLLFMRDARPMEASDAGLGANWPRPDQLWNAIASGFWRLWPQRDVALEGEKHTLNAQDRHQDNAFRFGALLTAGPFPCREHEGRQTCFFPCPLDLGIDSQRNLKPMTLVKADGTNLPSPLQYAYASPVLGKETPPQWVDAETMLKYLRGEEIKLTEEQAHPALFTADRNISVAIDGERGATVKGKLYQAEYLRLEPGVSLAANASCDLKAKHIQEPVDILGAFLEKSQELVMGGQQGVVGIDRQKSTFDLPLLRECPVDDKAAGPVRLRWTLLSPAVFPAIAANEEKGVRAHRGGWLPCWIDPENGQVQLRASVGQKPPRLPGETREAWRRRCQGERLTGAKLVAARIGKPLFFSGWKTATADEEAPKQTFAAVPAGSVYLFDCDTAATARLLWGMLNAVDASGAIVNRRSGVFGEKGFGLGACSIIQG